MISKFEQVRLDPGHKHKMSLLRLYTKQVEKDKEKEITTTQERVEVDLTNEERTEEPELFPTEAESGKYLTLIFYFSTSLSPCIVNPVMRAFVLD